MLKITHMKRSIPIILLSSLTIIFFTSCTKPEKKKTTIQQMIETPVIQMAEAPVNAPTINEKSALAPAAEQAPATAEPQAPTSPATPTILKNASNIEIIVDASGSMGTPMGQTSKIEGVITALKESLMAPLMPEAAGRKIALRVFGSGSKATDLDCHDTKLLLPLDKLNADKLDEALKQITPLGTSPIAFALEDVNNDFSDATGNIDNQVILITDSLDSCNGDIIAAVKRLNAGKGAIVDIIGFDIDQNAQDLLKQAAKAGNGTFYLARNISELASAVDQAISSSLPYNLRVKAMSGSSPLSSIITIYRANTQSIAERAESTGIKFFKLSPGSYDVRVDYSGSIEKTKPSKIIKGVDVGATSKTEQIVHFDLGAINITALSQNGKEAVANFYIRKTGSEDIIGSLIAVPSPQTIFLTPGKYDIDAETAEEGTATLTAQVKEILVKDGETAVETLKFQTGQLSIKAQNFSKNNVPISYRITKPGSLEVVASGTGPVEGAVIDLAPGKYDVYVAWVDPNIQGAPEVKLSDITINGGETLEQLALIVTGTLKLSGKDSTGKIVHTEFSIKKEGESAEVAKAVADSAPVEMFVAPGSYDVTALDTTSKVVPAPSILWENVTVKEGETVAKEAVFKLGTIKLIGKNAKQQTMSTIFTIYRGGTDEPLVTETSERDWIVFNLTPGIYDIKAEEAGAKSEPKPSVWFHDVEIKEGTTISNEAVFTSGKLKLLCMGTNNTILICEFNLFNYGSDTALFSGTTTSDWQEFDIPPGKYYMEAGWHDPKEEQFLKKWINISVNENEIVEEILRF